MQYPKASPRRFLSPAQLGFTLYFCAGFADGVVVPFFPLWAREQAGIAVGFIGLLFGLYAGGELLATPFLGGIADRIGRRPTLIASTFGVGIGFVCLFFTHGVIATGCVLLAIGVCESVLHPTISTVIAETTPEATHRRQFSYARVSSSIGKVLGPVTGAVLALSSLKLVFVASGCALLIGGIMTLTFLPETRHTTSASKEDDDEDGLSALIPAFRDRRLASLLLWFALLEITASWVEAALPLYARDAGVLSPSGVGILFAYGAALIAVTQLPLTHAARHRSALHLTLAAGGALMLSFAVLIVSPGLPALVVAVSLFGLAQMLAGPLVPAAINRLAPPHRRATYMAATSVASDLSDSLGPATGTALFAIFSRLPWILGMPCAAVAALGLGLAMMRPSGSVGTKGKNKRPPTQKTDEPPRPCSPR